MAESAVEVEIKLALPARWAEDPEALAARVAALPALARRSATRQTIYSVYYDTPEQALWRQRATLRLRRIDTAAGAQWRQTLKTATRCDSALSQRGEWEMPVAGPALELGRLASFSSSSACPWPALDPDGALAAALAPCFVTDFERRCWRLRLPGGGEVELALDVGAISAGDNATPIAEIEIERIAGPPEALFTLARRMARSLPLLPLAASKAERGFALRQQGDRAPEAITASPVALAPDLRLPAIARLTLGEMFGHFSANLHALQQSQAQQTPELVHQARVGWRRFRSLYRLLRPGLPAPPLPPRDAFKPLLQALGDLRDLDVARLHSLPPLEPEFVAGEPQRQAAWQGLQAALAQAAAQKLAVLRQALQTPALGQALLAWVQWLETVDGPLRPQHAPADWPEAPKRAATRRWLRRRSRRLADRLDAALAEAADGHLDAQHRARILAKRLRYGSEALASLLPRRLRQGRRRQAQDWQERLGAARDTVQAALLAQRLGAAPQLLAFLRGVAAGRTQR